MTPAASTPSGRAATAPAEKTRQPAYPDRSMGKTPDLAGAHGDQLNDLEELIERLLTPAAPAPYASASIASTVESGPSSYPGALCENDSNATGAYLNQFKEIVELIERLPAAPELIGDLLNWRPTSYNDYFAAQAMSGIASSADVYASLNRHTGKRFAGVAGDLDSKALGAAAAIRRHYKAHGEARPDIMMEICGRAGKNLREALGKASSLAKPEPGVTGGAGARGRVTAPQA